MKLDIGPRGCVFSGRSYTERVARRARGYSTKEQGGRVQLHYDVHPLKKLTDDEAEKVQGLSDEAIDDALATGRRDREKVEACAQSRAAVDPRIRFR